jgi:hypothetical protein
MIRLIILLACMGTLYQGIAQSDTDKLRQKFDAYQSTWPKPNLHLIFNQDKFAAGDTIWFKAYFLAEDLTGVVGKHLVEINLVDSLGRSIVHFSFFVNQGVGHNQLILPDTLPAGIYLLTAYNNWMKNFGPDNMFKKEIIVVQDMALKKEAAPLLKAVPEGGHLVAGIPNKVVVLTNQPTSQLQLMDDVGNEIGHTRLFNGIASFIFTPEQSTSYFVRRVEDSVTVSVPLAAVDGCALQLIPAKKEDPVKLLVRLPRGSRLRNEELIIIVNSRGRIHHSATFLPDSREVIELYIPQNELPEGIAHVSVLTSTGRLVASRDFYSPGKRSISAEIRSIKNAYQTRERVSLEISLTDHTGQPVQGEFTVNVRNEALLDTHDHPLFSDHLNFSNNLGNPFGIDRSDTAWNSMVDHYLIASTEPVPWERIMASNLPLPRYTYTSVRKRVGQAYFPASGEPLPVDTQILFFLQRSLWYYQTRVGPRGQVSITLPDIYEQDELFYLAKTERGKEVQSIRVEWESENPVALPRSSPCSEVDHPDYYASFAALKRLIDQSFGANSSVGGKSMNTHPERSDFEDEIMGANLVVQVQDYTLFPIMPELIKEVIPSMFYRKTRKGSMVRVQVPEPMRPSGDPLYIIDGIATKNTAFFLSLKPSELLTVKVINTPRKLLPLGLLGENGIVIIQTKEGSLREPLDDPAKIIEGLSRPLPFITRNYSDDKETRWPDFRTTIYWQPLVRTDRNGKALVEFYFSDDVGPVTIRVDGMATGGRPFSMERKLEVVLNPPAD